MYEIRRYHHRKMIERGAGDPYGRLFSYLNQMEDLGYDLGWCGHHRFSDRTAFGGDEASEPSAPFPIPSDRPRSCDCSPGK
jgi:hypothetical protein